MDKRIERTNTRLRLAFLNLLKKKRMRDITVLELCKEANINRTTFYKYYTDVEDYVNKLEKLLLGTLKEEIKNINRNYLLTYIDYIVKTIKSDKDTYQALLSKNGDKLFLRKILYQVYNESMIEWQRLLKKASKEELDNIYKFIVDGSTGIIENWIDNNCKDEPSSIAIFINKICMSGLSSFI